MNASQKYVLALGVIAWASTMAGIALDSTVFMLFGLLVCSTGLIVCIDEIEQLKARPGRR